VNRSGGICYKVQRKHKEKWNERWKEFREPILGRKVFRWRGPDLRLGGANGVMADGDGAPCDSAREPERAKVEADLGLDRWKMVSKNVRETGRPFRNSLLDATRNVHPLLREMDEVDQTKLESRREGSHGFAS